MIKSLMMIIIMITSPCFAMTRMSNSMHYESPCGSESLSVSVCFGDHDYNMMQLCMGMNKDQGIQAQGTDIAYGGDLAIAESYMNSVISSNIKITSCDRNTGWMSSIKDKEIKTEVISSGGGSNVMTTPDTYLALDNASPGTGVGIRAD